MSINHINILKENLTNKLIDSGWDKLLLPYVNSVRFEHIIDKLVDNVEQGHRFTPRFKDVFNGFYESPYKDTKVVIVGQDPYPQVGVADGIAFSCSRTGIAEKSLQYINKALGTKHVDLRCWSNQGVLLINTAFTCEINKIGSHYSIWKTFTEHVFKGINESKPDTVFVLMGKKAEAWQTLLPNCKILKCTHPASAAYRGGDWESNSIFDKVNDYLKSKDKACIEW